ncbi:MAG: T9SS type A sorting domain-containing protein, partial [Bacteroidota bacterium]
VVTDSTGSTASDTVIINEPPLLIIDAITSNPATCNGECDGDATVTPVGGAPPYFYFWNDPDTQTTATATGLCNGNYAGVVMDANGCFAGDTIIIPEPAVLSLIPGSSDATCGNNDGKAWISVTGGTPSYAYLWDDPLLQTTDTAFNLFAGNYMVIVTDTNGCSDFAFVTVNNPGAPSIIIDSATNISCNGGNDGEIYITVAGGTAPYTYLWSNTDTIEDIANLPAGTYTVTVTGSDSCASTQSIVLTEPPALILSITVDSNVSCNGFCDGIATVLVSGGTPPYTYLWDDGQPIATAMGLCSGTYYVNITDSAGCIAVDSATITEPLPLNIVITGTTLSTCFNPNGEACISVTGGTPPYTYVWDDPAMQTDSCAIMLIAGEYHLTVTDANGCIVIDTIIINDIPGPAIDSISTADITCFGACDGSATLTASGGTAPFTYIWKNFSGDTIGVGSDSISGLCEGTYIATVIDSNSCFTSTAFIINEPPLLIYTIISLNDASCNGFCDGDVTAMASGGTFPYTYFWDDSLAQTTATADSLCSGSYSVIISDANGCSVVDSVFINEFSALASAIISSTPVSCNGFCDGSASVMVAGGLTPYTYLWSGGQTTSSATGLCSNTNTVIITDANGCQTTNTVVITEPDPLVINDFVIDVSCYGMCDGSIYITDVTGGTPFYSYMWIPGTPSPGSVCPGTYNLTVTDINGCTATDSITVNEPPLITLTTSLGTAICYDQSTQIFAFASGGVGDYTFSWDNGLLDTTTHLVSPLVNTTYTVTVTDSTGCVASGSITINVYPPLSVSVSALDDTICEGDSTMLIAYATGGGPYWAYYYTWLNDGSTSSSITVSPTAITIYTVVANDSCSLNDTASITVVVESCTGLETLTGFRTLSGFNIYPNPAEGIITLDIELDEANNIEIHLYNILGELLYNESLQNISKHKQELDLKGLPDGVYLVKFISNYYSINRRIVIVK